MAEREPKPMAAAMSRAGFLKKLALLAGAFGLAGSALSALSLPGGGPSRPDSGPRPAAPPAIHPPTRSVKRRG